MIIAALLVAALSAPPPKTHPRPYGRGAAYFHKTEIAPYRFENEIVKVNLDYAHDRLTGVATNVIHPKADGLTSVPFHSLDLHYSGITVNGTPARYHLLRDRVIVDLPSPAKASDTLTIVATYSARPKTGVYFIHPDKAYPKLQPEIWTQGEEEDNRRWYPTWDEPNEKSPTELVVTVPHGWTVVANGSLVAHRDDGSSATWDWIERYPHSSYLTAFSAGPYVRVHDSLGTLPVDYFVPQADAPFARQCFTRTPQMIAFFQSKIGVPFPWEKYDQTLVERFTAGGMENASETTLTETMIHPPQAELENSCDGLIAHELAHQWWGDDVTAADWANIWINEGFATYFEELWAEHHFGEAQFQYERYHAQDAYFNETKRYWRPIVEYTYAQAGDSFDSSGYPRPGQVIHMMRYLFGEQAFWKALHDYLTAYERKTADTAQYEAAMEQSTGLDLKWFFNEWFHRAAYPDYTVRQSYDARGHSLTLDVTQKNHDGKPFAMPVDVQVTFGNRSKTQRFQVGALHQKLTLTGITQPPVMVLFDPNNNILRKLHFKKSVAELHYQARNAASVADRLWAVAALGDVPKAQRAQARAAVRDAVTHDPFYGVRADALDAATTLDDAATVEVALHDRDPRVVIAAANAVSDLDHPSSPGLIASLKGLAASPDPLVAGAALHGLGATKAPGVYATLAAGLNRHALREPVARGAVAGLAAYGDIRALAAIEKAASYGSDEALRNDAIGALGTLAKKRPELVTGFLTGIVAHDPYFRARRAAERTLGKLGDPAALPTLRRAQQDDVEQSVRNGAYDAIADIQDAVKAKAHKTKSRG